MLNYSQVQLRCRILQRPDEAIVPCKGVLCAYAAVKVPSVPRLTNILIGPLASSVHGGEWRQIGRAERKILRHPDGLFDELLTSVDQTAAIVAALAELGVRPEDRVLSMLADGPGFAEAFVGTFAHGAIPLPVNPLLPAH
jgi:hypothetical protein